MEPTMDGEGELRAMMTAFDERWGAGGWSWTESVERRERSGAEALIMTICAVIEREAPLAHMDNRLVWPVRVEAAIVGGDVDAARADAVGRGRLECARQWMSYRDGGKRARREKARGSKPGAGERRFFRGGGNKGDAPRRFRFSRKR